MGTLKPVYYALEELAATSSRKEKERLLEKFLQDENFKKTVIYAADQYKQFNVLSVDFIPIAKPYSMDMLFKYLYSLSEKKGATLREKEVLSSLSSFDEESVEVVKRILNKDLRCGVGIKTIQKFLPDIREYGVMKPQTDKKTLHSDFDRFLSLAEGWEGFNVSTKVDGVRICNCVVHENGEVEYFSTNGKKYRNFHCFDEAMRELAISLDECDYPNERSYPMEFDGEVISYDGNFQSVVTQTQRENEVDTSNLRFLVWSVVGPGPFEERYKIIEELLPAIKSPITQQDVIGPKSKHNVFCLYHEFNHNLKSWKDVELLAREVISTGEEGIVLKTNEHLHERKRSREWFRLKALYLEGEGVEVDLPVTGWQYGTGKFEKMLGALLCDYNGETVKVGGGFTEAQRKEFIINVPKYVTVNADSETNDGSLRFPQFARVREEK